MSIEVTIKHNGYPQTIRVSECNEVGQAIKGTDRMIHGGEAATFAVHETRQLHISAHGPAKSKTE
jgi:hypothetical protein